MRDFTNIVILTGAGISAESGLQTFRATDGLWCGHRIEDVATSEGFARDADTVQNFYNMRRRHLAEVEPNAAHLALATLAAEWPGKVTLITQNVDELHQRAHRAIPPSPRFAFYNMHGELKKVRCTETENVFDWSGDIEGGDACPCCTLTGTLRPHIVWFGEMPLFMDEIDEALVNCDLFLSIGTSGNVYPAAGFVQMLRHRGRAYLVELNLEPSLGSHHFHEIIHGAASVIIPEYINKIICRII